MISATFAVNGGRYTKITFLKGTLAGLHLPLKPSESQIHVAVCSPNVLHVGVCQHNWSRIDINEAQESEFLRFLFQCDQDSQAWIQPDGYSRTTIVGGPMTKEVSYNRQGEIFVTDLIETIVEESQEEGRDLVGSDEESK